MGSNTVALWLCGALCAGSTAIPMRSGVPMLSVVGVAPQIVDLKAFTIPVTQAGLGS